MQPTSFSSVTALVPGAPGHFDAEINGEWTIGGKPNGGYLLALLGRAAVATAAHPHVLAASAHYLTAPDPGPAQLQADVLRDGRTASQLRVRLTQDGRDCVEALVTVGRLADDGEPFWSRVPDSPTAPRSACVRVPARAPNGLLVPIMDQVDLRLDPATLGFAAGKPSSKGELRGWLQLHEDENFDPVALLYAADALPPATFEIALTGWVPTLELTVYVRALPAPGPVRVMHRAQLIDGQRVDETCHVWDSRDRLVAQATQLAGIRLGD